MTRKGDRITMHAVNRRPLCAVRDFAEEGSGRRVNRPPPQETGRSRPSEVAPRFASNNKGTPIDEGSITVKRLLISALVAPGLTLALPASAQEQASQIVGVWKFQKFDRCVVGGACVPTYGDNPTGTIVNTKSFVPQGYGAGRMASIALSSSLVTINPDRMVKTSPKQSFWPHAKRAQGEPSFGMCGDEGCGCHSRPSRFPNGYTGCAYDRYCAETNCPQK
jgi:hypothetical protein